MDGSSRVRTVATRACIAVTNEYCTKCGMELAKVATGEFDSRTGKKEHKLQCPSNICDHDGVGCDTEPRKGFFGWLAGNHAQCKRCGEIYGVYSGAEF